MSPERTDDTASELELAKINARANLLLALYAHVSHDLEQSERSTLLATELQERLDDILNSTSWRLTAPLRALARLVKSAP
jgi:hypothetical protein